jgi:RNA polymerase sigma-70 factor (ECF subfamily)
MSVTSDRDLIIHTRRGEIQAFGELVHRYQNSVFSVCYRMLGERREAEDMTQETFVRAYERLETFDIDRDFGPWIRRVAVNITLNHLQRNRPPQFPLDEEFDLPIQQTQSSPEASLERSERSETIKRAILALPAHYRAVIELRHFQELSYAEISSALHISLSDVKTRLFRARKRLAKRIEGHV